MKLVMTKGLPGSGKTHWAKHALEVEPNTALVCKDDLRAMLFNSAWTGNREKFILKMRDFIITSALESGRNVIVHDTNFAPKHEIRLREIAKQFNAEFEIKDFTYVPIEQCIHNDLCREDSVGEKVIREMYRDWIMPKPAPIEDIPGIQRAIMCDLDGTLCLFGDKNPYERDFENDEINSTVRYILEGNDQYNEIIFISGRSSKYKDVTKEWLNKYGFGNHLLFMRKENDKRKDSIVKKEIYEEHIKGKYNVLFVLDDRNQVVELWRSLGLTCLQVAEGDF